MRRTPLVLVEDDALAAAALSEQLHRHGFSIEVAGTCAAALERFRRPDFGAAIVDLGLPDGDSLGLIAAARKEGLWAPILVATARAPIEERVRALEAGADDYLVKPFATAEAAARLHALIRRAAAPRWAPLHCGDVVLTADGRGLTVRGRLVALSPREHALATLLLRRRGQVIERKEILDQVFGYNFDPQTNALAVHVAHLREKLTGSDVVIETVRGVGLRLDLRKPRH